MSKNIGVTISIRRKYGDHEIEFSLQEFHTVENGLERRDAFNDVLSQLNDQILVYETTFLKDYKPTQPTGEKHHTRTEIVPLTSIVVEHKNGVRHVSCKGGIYKKFGVACYDDSCQTEMNLDTLDYGEHVVVEEGLMMTVDIVNNKAQRVLAIK